MDCLANMSPIAPGKSGGNRRSADAKLSGNLPMEHARHVHVAGAEHVGFGQLGPWMFRAMEDAAPRSVLCNAIPDVVCVRSQEQMSRVAARRVVAPMENVECAGVSDKKQISDSMRFPRYASKADHAVSVMVSGHLPFPAPALGLDATTSEFSLCPNRSSVASHAVKFSTRVTSISNNQAQL
jgi:hypothetical protein